MSNVLVRDWDSKNFREITRTEWDAAEKSAGKTSAFAEVKAISNLPNFDGERIVIDTGMTVSEFLRHRNAR